jgi:DNA (cytosine-5)-methyltransferase 1
MDKPRLLDLFCGAGGSAKGYQRAGFYVVGVDIKPQPHYCGDEFHQADALTYPLDGFDAYHASPPCQAYVDFNSKGKKENNHPRLIEPIRARLETTGKPYVIENIHMAPLKAHILMCGSMFNLRVRRHRYFEAPCLPLLPLPCCNHSMKVSTGELIGVYARGGHGPRHGKNIREPSPRSAQCTPEQAMGIDWMTKYELTQAIPPAYTEYIGKYLMQAIQKPII